MKKHVYLAIILAVILAFGSIGTAMAEIISPFGFGQIGLSSAVLCEKLTLRAKPSTSAKAIATLKFGDHIIVTDQADGWARCVLGDSEDAASGWVNSDYIVIDPAWYRTEEKTPVFAWNDLYAPKVALLDANTELLDPNTFLPILKDEGDWLLVSLRGGTGWIYVGEGRREGEKFYGVVMLEGMEETVRYERIRNDAIGFEMGYDYDNFVRQSGTDRERIVSDYDDPNSPENYLELTYVQADAAAAAAKVGAELSKYYEINTEEFVLDRAGSCLRIDASADIGGKTMPDQLQMVYIIPAGAGSIVATAHYSIEGAEGFGARFRGMMHTLEVIER